MIKKIFLFLIPVLAVYFLLAYYYKDGFCLNTWINGIYCTGKTVEEINAELLSETEAPIIVITDKDGEQYTIDMAELGFSGDYIAPLNRYREEQNVLLWIDNITFHQKHEITPAVTYDEQLLRETFEQQDFVKDETQRLNAFLLVRNWKDGYFLYDGQKERLDVEKAFASLQQAIAEGQYALDLVQAECYYDIPLTEEENIIKQLWEKVDAFQQCNLVYDMGDEQITFDAAMMSDFIKTSDGEVILDENGSLMLDEEGIQKFVSSLAAAYDTYGKERKFQSTRGDVITVKGGTYGTEINQEEEIAYLMKHLLSAELHTDTAQVHIPSYKREGLVRGKNDIGSTYIEIDMTEQKMYYYEDGDLKLETEIVTGNTGRKMGTPEGVYYVYNKQKNRVLRGPGYASPVSFWMPVKGNIGIHDANWRGKFGGTIYQTNGSHGCINTPAEKMKELYDMVEIGIPVIMFY